MNEPPYQRQDPGPLRTFLSIAGYGMMFTYSMLFLTGALFLSVNLLVNYGWLFRGELPFASHWNPAQRAAMQQLEHAVRCDNVVFTDVMGLYSDALADGEIEDTLTGAWKRDTYTMPYASKADDALRDFVQASPDEARWMLQKPGSDLQALVFASVEMGQWPALRVFAEMGYPVNLAAKDGETLLSAVLSNMKSLPASEVLAQADWLLSLGSEIRPESSLLSAVALADDECATLEWLLQHGLPLELWRDEKKYVCLPLDVCVTHGVALPVFERLVTEGKLDVNDRRAGATYLQAAANYVEVEALACLLRLGAQPELLPEAPSSDEGDATPVSILLQGLATHESAGEAESALAGLRLLLQHGASPQPLPSEWTNPQICESVRKLYAEFGHREP